MNEEKSVIEEKIGDIKEEEIEEVIDEEVKKIPIIKEDIGGWNPKTKIGKLVKSGEIKERWGEMKNLNNGDTNGNTPTN